MVSIKKFCCWMLFVFTLPATAGGNAGVPWSFVFFQALNFLTFLMILFYLLKKKLPPILQQKRKEFIAYKNQAGTLEKENREKCFKLEQEVLALDIKAKNIHIEAQNSIKKLREEKQQEYLSWLECIKQQQKTEIERRKKKEIELLKNWILSKVFPLAKERLSHWPSQDIESYKKYNNRILDKEWKVQ